MMVFKRRWLLWVSLICALACVLGVDLRAGRAQAPASAPGSGNPATQPGASTRPGSGAGAGGLGSLPAGARVAVLPIKEAITMDVYTSMKSRIARAVQQGASVIVVRIDSDAGDMDVARMVAEELRLAPVATVAWIDRQALGPAAIVVSACHEVVTGPGPVVGVIDAQAALKNGTAALVSDRLGPIFDALEAGAARSGTAFAFYEAMAVPGVEVYLISHKNTGQKKVVNQTDYAVLVGGKDPDAVREAEIARVAQKYKLPLPARAQDKLKLPDGTEIEPRSLGAVLSAEPAGGLQEMGQWVLDRQVHSGKVAWALTDPDIAALGFARGQVGSDADIQARYQASGVILIDKSWPEGLAYWLISGPVRAALIILMVIGIFIELKIPGLGWGGGVAIVCAAVLIGAPFMVGLASFWHVLVFLLGIILLGVEVFVLPGFGVVGVAGVALILLGLVLLIVPTGPGGGYNTIPSGLITRILLSTSAWTLVGMVGGLVGLLVVLKFLPEIPGVNRLILTSAQPASGGVDSVLNDGKGTVMAGAEAGISGDEALGQGRISVGSVGYVLTGLRPAGLARFGEDTVDVMATTGWVAQGGQVKVTQVEGNRIYVEPLDGAVV
jgi:membrane-bound serine protease (ClpP class)